MKIGVMAVLFSQMPFEAMLDRIKAEGCETVEIGCGGYPGDAHCKPQELLNDADARKAFKDAITSRGLEISALSCHGNPLHPNQAIAQKHDQDFRQTVKLAAELGVSTVITFSGCPGDSDQAKAPNWVTCPWPTEYLETLNWQWANKVTPYWQEAGQFAREYGINVAIELHPGFVAYNTDSFWRLREIGGDNIGVNFDPSHLFWQQMDPLVCIRELKDTIYHVHMKDTWLDEQNIRRNGVLDTTVYTDEIKRSWIFRTVGYGHGQDVWRAMISQLRLVGYDGALSIEHEDSLIGIDEGFAKAVAFLKQSVISEQTNTAWWV